MRRIVVFPRLTAVAAALLSLAACAGAAGSVVTSLPHPAFARVQTDEDIDGIPAAKYLRAGEPTVLVVFASWCVHCRRELAVLTELRAVEPHVHVIGLNAYEEWEQVSDETGLRAYLAENAPWLPVVRADDALLAALGGVPKIPSVFVFDGRGRLVEEYQRNQRTPPTLAELRELLASLR